MKLLISGQAREVDLKLEMGQTSEKLYSLDDRYKNVEKERDELKRRYYKYSKQTFSIYLQENNYCTGAYNFSLLFRCKEVEAKLEVVMRSKQASETTISEKVSHLEKALEEVTTCQVTDNIITFEYYRVLLYSINSKIACQWKNCIDPNLQNFLNLFHVGIG